MDQSKEPTGITEGFRKHRFMLLMEVMTKGEGCPRMQQELRGIAVDVERCAYSAASTVGSYTATLDEFVADIPNFQHFKRSTSEDNSRGGFAQAGPGTAQNPQLPHSQDPMGQGLAPPQLPQGAAAAAAVPSPSPQPPAPPASGPAAQASADEVWHIASGLMDLDLDSEQQP